MIICGITILYQGGTEFRIGPFTGTQFRLRYLALQKKKSHILKTGTQKWQRGE